MLFNLHFPLGDQRFRHENQCRPAQQHDFARRKFRSRSPPRRRANSGFRTLGMKIESVVMDDGIPDTEMVEFLLIEVRIQFIQGGGARDTI